MVFPQDQPVPVTPHTTSPAGEQREEGLSRDEAQARLVAEQQQRQQSQSRKRRSSPAGWPPAAAPAAAEAPKVVTVHDLFSDAPVVLEAPAGDGGLQSMHCSEETLGGMVKEAARSSGPCDAPGLPQPQLERRATAFRVPSGCRKRSRGGVTVPIGRFVPTSTRFDRAG